MGRTKTVSLIALGGALLVWGLGFDACGPAKKPVDSYLLNRVWADRVPKSRRDVVLHFALATKAKRNLGFVARHSLWRMYIDVVRFEVDERAVTVVSPQEQTRTRFTYRTRKCKGEAPKGFDLCLDLSRGGRTLRLYSKADAAFAEDAPLAEVMTRATGSTVLLRTDFDENALACEDCPDRLPSWFEAGPVAGSGAN